MFRIGPSEILAIELVSVHLGYSKVEWKREGGWRWRVGGGRSKVSLPIDQLFSPVRGRSRACLSEE